jgi:hypothetical protein
MNKYLKIFFLFSVLITSSKIQAQNQFEQGLSYDIEVSLADSNGTLQGSETIEYTNNSKDTLREIYIHLYPNAYKNDKTALSKQFVERLESTELYFAKDENKGYIKNFAFQIDGIPVSYAEYLGHEDIAVLRTPQPLLPGKKVTIITPFFVKLPKAVSRSGRYDKRGFAVTQWYPKIAMYDNAGWHPQPYLDMGEFYSNFASYNVKISLPIDYLIASTGSIQDETEKENLANRASLTKSLYKYLSQKQDLDTIRNLPLDEIKKS